MNKYCVTLVCNEGFLDSALFVVQRLMSCEGQNFDVVICSNDDLSKKLPDFVLFKHIDTEEFTATLPENSRLKKFTYWRIPAIEKLTKVYEKVLYLDTDIYINTRNIGEIFSLDMKHHVLAASLDVHQVVRPTRIPKEFRALGRQTSPTSMLGCC